VAEVVRQVTVVGAPDNPAGIDLTGTVEGTEQRERIRTVAANEIGVAALFAFYRG
jgi:hypothetical protein